MTRIVKAGIVGGAGYAGGELIRLLLLHPQVEICGVQSSSNHGQKVSSIHTDLFGDTELTFTKELPSDIDAVFLCDGGGANRTNNPLFDFPDSTRIIDLSKDNRVTPHPNKTFTYGLPELHRTNISTATNIANPGCFATAIQLALLPLAANKMLESDIHITCTTGSTGAGQTLKDTSHFTWRQNNLSTYSPFTHNHLLEIHAGLEHLQPSFSSEVIMIPQRGSFTRGIMACCTVSTSASIEPLYELYNAYYAAHPFVHISNANIDLKQVVNTNKCLIHLEKHANTLLIVSVIDNLLKGASGQAVQNMNLMFGIEETTGLKLKASAF
ncbi:MAG: N-acetyl-gamma-glutamyl-phosphate reductase [Ignavibacteria bacterium]|nr:N-acetyl-gamma-glutamyl-phosphate reductase [Ignavibacteria bacterium]